MGGFGDTDPFEVHDIKPITSLDHTPEAPEVAQVAGSPEPVPAVEDSGVAGIQFIGGPLNLKRKEGLERKDEYVASTPRHEPREVLLEDGTTAEKIVTIYHDFTYVKTTIFGGNDLEDEDIFVPHRKERP